MFGKGDIAVVGSNKRFNFLGAATAMGHASNAYDIDAKFPGQRICRAEIYTKDGRRFVSPDCAPRGEAHEGITNDWLANKFRRMIAPIVNAEGQNKILDSIVGDENQKVRNLIDTTNREIL